jgi:hypothetical protein
MTTDTPFRIALAVIVAACLVIGIHHRLKAASGEHLNRREEGLVILIALRLVALVLFLATLAWMTQPRLVAWASLPLPISARWAGALLGVLGVALMY